MVFSCIVYIILGISLPVSWNGLEGKYSNLHSLLKDKMPCLTRGNIQKVKKQIWIANRLKNVAYEKSGDFGEKHFILWNTILIYYQISSF